MWGINVACKVSKKLVSCFITEKKDRAVAQSFFYIFYGLLLIEQRS